MDYEDFDWSVVANEKVTSVEIDGDTLHINYQTGNLQVSLVGMDWRERSKMNILPCNLPPDGCCFEHASCGDDYCNTHSPYQILTMECSTEEFIGKTITSFGCYDLGHYQFTTDKQDNLDFFVSNDSLYAYNINFDFMKY